MAQEGADIIAADLCAQIDSVDNAMSTPGHMEETVGLVEAEDRRIVASVADVRDLDGLREVVDAGVAHLGRLDIIVANPGIGGFGSVLDITEQQWDDIIDVDLKGVWLTAKVGVPHILTHGEGASDEARYMTGATLPVNADADLVS
jgi:(+)-trans-carveol dehydrogenase